MDRERFDELVRRLAEERNRRSVVSGIGGALVASVGLVGGGDAEGKDRANVGAEKTGEKDSADGGKSKKGKDQSKDQGKGKGKDRDSNGKKGDKRRDRNPNDYDQPRQPGIEGPCGSGSRKDNICMRNSECCTGICAVEASKKNKDKKGRCRCLRMGSACNADRNCCNSLCIGGICGSLS